MKIILKPGEVAAMGLPRKEMTLTVEMREGNKPNVICMQGAGIMGAVVENVRMNIWIKPATGEQSANKKTL